MNEIAKNISHLLIREPFYGYLLHSFKREEHSGAIMATTVRNGKPVLFYNPECIKQLTGAQIRAVLKHECLHHINQHITRGKTLRRMIMHPQFGQVDLFNLAADMSINQYISDLPDGCVKLPDGWPVGASAKVYYDLLMSDEDPSGGSDTGDSQSAGDGGGGQSESGDAETQGDSAGEGEQGAGSQNWQDMPDNFFEDQHEAWGRSSGEDLHDETFKTTLQQAKEIAQQTRTWGNIPGGLQGLIDAALKPQVNWRREVRKWRGQLVQRGVQQTRNRPNRRLGYEAPGKTPDFTGKLVVFIDTSASVDDESLSQFLSEARGASKEIQVVLVDVDTQIQKVRQLKGREKTVQIHGRGGTCFDECFEAIRGNFPEFMGKKERALIGGANGVAFLTDGGVMVRHAQPKIPVLWVYTANHHKPVDWGKHIVLAEN